MPIASLERDSKSKMSARMQNARHCLAIVLAAGEGKRMRSTLSKTLHPIAGRPMISHVITTVRDAGADRVVVVVGPKGEEVAAAAGRAFPKVEVFEQSERRGTAHAVLVARAALARASDDVLVVFGDTPLIEAATLSRMRGEIAHGADCVVLGFEAHDPTGYGRLIRQDGALLAIREERDASEKERAITLCNGGLMGFSARQALPILERISDRNAQREFYLTDAVEIARAMGLVTRVILASEAEVMGVNDRIQLAAAEAKMQCRLREAAMRAGVTLVAPELVFLSHDTQFGPDVVVEPHVVFGPGVVIDKGATVRAFSHIEGAHIGAGTIIGPFARLRPGATIGEGAHVGNFVEVKNTHIGRKAKANHLAYLGDSTVGEGANIGAGTITCNYDGFDKHRTQIGDGAFIGTNSSLVAPVTIGEGAYIGSGSVITDDVPKDALALGRARQAIKAGWAKTFREKKRRHRKT